MNLDTLGAGDRREVISLQVRIDYHNGFAELARERGEPAMVKKHLIESVSLYGALCRLEKSIDYAESVRKKSS